MQETVEKLREPLDQLLVLAVAVAVALKAAVKVIFGARWEVGISGTHTHL